MNPSVELAPFKTYINKVVTINDAQWQSLQQLIQIKSYRKKELFQKEGVVCTQVGFILQGCFRSVKDNDGDERTFDFAVENEFVTEYYSILNKTPSGFNIVAVEDSVIALMNSAALFKLFDSDMVWQQFGRKIAEQTWCYYQQRLLSAFFDTPQRSYEKLLTEWPDVVLRVPQHIIANYLGITKETLSRIRKRISK
jgi:CRP-like cAMP-binding protein